MAQQAKGVISLHIKFYRFCLYYSKTDILLNLLNSLKLNLKHQLNIKTFKLFQLIYPSKQNSIITNNPKIKAKHFITSLALIFGRIAFIAFAKVRKNKKNYRILFLNKALFGIIMWVKLNEAKARLIAQKTKKLFNNKYHTFSKFLYLFLCISITSRTNPVIER